MIEPNQILLYIVIVVLTAITAAIGWQIFLILSEMRKMLSKFNLMADGAVSVTQNIGRSLRSINGFSDGLKTAFGVFKVFKKKGSSQESKVKEAENE